MPKLIAITGGIGSGKSVVCNILKACGFKVYNCDDEARRIMDSDSEIWAKLCRDIHPDAVRAGVIDRPLISSVVFSDGEKLKALNAIVHRAVEADLRLWVDAHSGEKVLFVETAILYQSGLDRLVDADWQVVAPEEVRIERVMKRNGLSREAVRARIASQTIPPPENPVPTDEIINDNLTPILPQIEALL